MPPQPEATTAALPGPGGDPWRPSVYPSAQPPAQPPVYPPAYPPASLGSPPRGPDYLASGVPPSGPPGYPPLLGGGSEPPVPPRRRRRLAALVGTVALLAALLGSGIGAALGVRYERGRRVDASTGPPLRAGAPAVVERPPGSVAAIAARLLPSVVTVNVSSAAGSDTGSGVIIRSDGYVLTNNHVIAAAATTGEITADLYHGAQGVHATLVGRDPKTDLAVIRLTGSGLPAATLGRSSSLVVGDPVVAIGAPLALASTVTSGIVSALDRNVTVPDESGTGSNVLIGAIQTDAAINPGNSGGPLVDASGQVVGINSAIATVPGASATGSQSGSIGVGFSIPVDYARSIAQEIIDTGKATHPYLGVEAETVSPDDAKAQGTVVGAHVTKVVGGGPADLAGLRVGDVVTQVNATAVSGVNDLVAATRLHRIGDRVTITYRRGSQVLHATAVLQESKG